MVRWLENETSLSEAPRVVGSVEGNREGGVKSRTEAADCESRKGAADKIDR